MEFTLFDERWLPKSVLCLRDYSLNKFLHDLLAGITVGLVALPLAMAFAIASGLTPQAGIYCAVVTGFLISALGGSTTQIGGPTYIGSLHVMFPHIPLIASGGVNQQTAANFILSGAIAIGVGTELIPTEAIQRRQSQRIHELARRFARLVKDAREQIAAWKKTQVVKQYTGTEKCEK